MGIVTFLTAFNINLSMDGSEEALSLLSLANIEALAEKEKPISDTRSCYKTISMDGPGNPTHVTYCGSCDAQLARTWKDSGSCNHNHPL